MVHYIGDAGANSHDGTVFKDTLEGLGGNDTLEGADNNDSILGGDGEDRLIGGAGKDTIFGGAERDLIGDTEDTDVDHLNGDDGDDDISGAWKDVLDGGAGALDRFSLRFDMLPAVNLNFAGLNSGGSYTVARTTVSGFERGAFFLTPGDDKITAADGMRCQYNGMDGADTLIGGDQDDTLTGGGGSSDVGDVMKGGAGNDRANGGPGDSMQGGDGTDTFELHFESISTDMDVDFSPIDTSGFVSFGVGGFMNGFEQGNATFGSGNDKVKTGATALTFVTGGFGNDTMISGDGGDRLDGGMGNDVIRGGLGADEATFFNIAGAITLDLSNTGFQDTGGAGVDKFSEVENVFGSFFDDRFTGDAQNNRLTGWLGGDTLIGGVGNDLLIGGSFTTDTAVEADRLSGGAGQDTLAAGGGADVLVWSSTFHTTVAAPDQILALEAIDVLHLKDIDADVTTAGDQAFTVVVAFSSTAGELARILVSGTTHFVMDVDGDGVADADITALGDHTGHTGFVL
jgi:Ca2+-binding RTX toxin-like protein